MTDLPDIGLHRGPKREPLRLKHVGEVYLGMVGLDEVQYVVARPEGRDKPWVYDITISRSFGFMSVHETFSDADAAMKWIGEQLNHRGVMR